MIFFFFIYTLPSPSPAAVGICVILVAFSALFYTFGVQFSKKTMRMPIRPYLV